MQFSDFKVGKMCNPNRKSFIVDIFFNFTMFCKNFFIYCVFFISLKHIDYNKMSKYIQKVEKCSFLISRSVKCVTRTTKVDNSVLSEPEIFSFITRFLLENRVFLHLKRINHNNFYYCIFFYLTGI